MATRKRNTAWRKADRLAAGNSLSELFSELAANRAEFHRMLERIERRTGLDLDTEIIATEIDADFPDRDELGALEAHALLARSAIRGLRIIEGRP